MKHLGMGLENFLGSYVVVMPDFFEEIEAVHWPLAFLTKLFRNLPFVLGCVIFGETSWYGPRKHFGGLKICGGNARSF